MSCVEQSVVLVMCGSFNPLTYTHLRVMEMSRDLLQYQGIKYLFTGLLSYTLLQYQGTKYLFTGLFSYTLYSKKSEYSLNRILSSSPFSEGGGYRSQLLATPPLPPSPPGIKVVGGILSPVHDDYYSQKRSLMPALHRRVMVKLTLAEQVYIL